MEGIYTGLHLKFVLSLLFSSFHWQISNCKTTFTFQHKLSVIFSMSVKLSHRYIREWTFAEEKNQDVKSLLIIMKKSAKVQSTLLIVKLPWDDYKNVVKEEDISEYRLQREDYWIKILRNPYHDLNQKTKFTN